MFHAIGITDIWQLIAATFLFLAAIGVAALLHANPMLLRALQYLGAAYLAYLGARLLFARGEGGGTVVPFSNAADFRRGLLVTLINPKAIVFYMAFFPLFLDPATQQGALTFVAMGTVICCCTALYGAMLVVVGNALSQRRSRQRTLATLASRLAGIFLIGFGIQLTTQ